MYLPPELRNAGLDPRDVKPGMTGVIFLIVAEGASEPALYISRFLRVRTIKDQVNMADMEGVVKYAEQLSACVNVFYCAFSAGRNTPLPGSNYDLEQMAKETEGRNGFLKN